MNYCVDFALANRKLMMNRIMDIFSKETQCGFPGLKNGSEDFINIAHNYARMENHFGSNVMVHRKGATLATDKTIGIIPGSQGTKSYIVKGLGNAESFQSCSHGAGRKMGRKDAVRSLNLQDEIKKLDDLGVVHAIRTQQDLEEAPSAYKDIIDVMKNQEDLVEILVELTPLAVIKA
jgi:tRNA-splicing ligase RtcB